MQDNSTVEALEQELPEINESEGSQEEGSQVEEQGEETPEAPKDENEPEKFPRKAENAIRRRDQKLHKYKSELAQLKAEVEALKTQPQKKEAPQEAEFNDYGDYLKAQILHEMEEKGYGKPAEQKQVSPEEAQQEQYMQQRAQYTAQKTEEFLATTPDYQQVYAENLDVFTDLSPEVQDAFLELDNPPAAFYALAKEGKLEELAMMPLQRALLELGRAEARGSQPQRKITSAPPPIKSNKGMGRVNQHPVNMSDDEFEKWLKI